jgi:hypothetical protein
MRLFIAPLIAFSFYSTVAMSKDVKMTGDEMNALLSSGKTLSLGGKGQGYAGTLVLSADGKGEGSAKPDSGGQIKLSGTWKITGDKFCRIWADLDDGKEVCETWVKAGPSSVKVMKGKKQIGMNSW